METMKYKVKVEDADVQALRAYSDETGISITHCVREAIRDYLEVVVPARLEGFRLSHGEIPRKAPRPAARVAKSSSKTA